MTDSTRKKRPRDPNQLAKLVVDIATEEEAEASTRRADTAAQKRGRKGGKARADNLTAEQRHEIARIAAEARWRKGKS